MSVRQISVFLENRPGTLSAMTGALAKHKIDMRAFSLTETSEFGIARIIVSDVDRAASVLREAGFVCDTTSVIGAVIDDSPGGVDKALSALSEAGINVEYMYAFLGRKENAAYMVFRVADDEKAAEVLREKGIPLIDARDLAEL